MQSPISNLSMSHLETFTHHRPHLFAIAYRMLGSAMDADDMVQETFIRWQAAPEVDVQSPKAYLTTILTRLCIDQLRSAQTQRETYIGPWLPEPMLTDPTPGPADSVALAESLSLAFLTLLESLSPIERAVFLLREVFDYEYAEIADIVGKAEANCRQMVSRAKAHLAAGRPRFRATPEQHAQMLWQFGQALTTGDLPGLIALLTDDIVAYSDGGGKTVTATHPVHGPDRVARLYLGLIHKAPPTLTFVPGHANGQPVILTYLDGKLYNVLTLDLAPDGRICAIYNVVNPDKLRGVLRI